MKSEQSCKVELRHSSAWKANCSFQKLLCHGEALYIFKSPSVWNELSLRSHTSFGRTAMGSAFKTV